jgi:hypothetical protein
MSAQPEEADKQKKTNILFKKTKILGYNVSNYVLFLTVLAIVYLLCRDSTKPITADVSALEAYTRGVAEGAKNAITGPAPSGQTGGFMSGGFGRSNKFQFDY